jgi:prepilin-type processing-associated H-X9-DG protein
MPPAYNSDDCLQQVYRPDVYPAAPYTPTSLICPADTDPVEAHSYVLNGHLCRHGVRAGNHNFGGLTAPEVIYAGEKMTFQRDYFMQNKDFDRVVDRYRHGLMRGSNFLYLDGHAGTVLPRLALTGIDPWDLRTADVSKP